MPRSESTGQQQVAFQSMADKLAAALKITPMKALSRIYAYMDSHPNATASEAYAALGGGLVTEEGETPPGDQPPGGPTAPGTTGGGSTGVSAADLAAQKANTEASFLNMIRSWGLTETDKLLALVKNAVNQKWNSARFIDALRGTQEYQHAFPGIQWKTGQTEAQYMAAFNAFQDRALDIGMHMTRQQFGTLQRKGVDTAEWSLRVQAIKSIRSNKQAFADFREVLVERGLMKPNERFKPKDLYDFVTGKGSAAWTQIWNEAYMTTVLGQQGIDVGTDIGRKALLKVLKGAEAQIGAGGTVKVDFAALAQGAAALPASRLYSLGITKKDLVKLALNAPDAPKIAARVNLALGTAMATATEVRATPDLTRQGLYQGTPQVQATE